MGGVGGTARQSRHVRRHVSTAQPAEGKSRRDRNRRNLHGDQAIAQAIAQAAQAMLSDFLPKISPHWRPRSGALVISGPKESFSAPRLCASRVQA